MLFHQPKIRKYVRQSPNYGLILQQLGKFNISFSAVLFHIFLHFFADRNPTPDTSNLPKWHSTQEFPLNYYRIGNTNHDGKPMFGMEEGLFDDRARFWREIGAHLPARSNAKEEL